MADNLIIYGSPFKDSFTARLLQPVAESLNGQTTFFNCFESSPLPCDGCGYCKRVTACRHKDLDEFFKDFISAKNVIFAFPVYNGSFPAPLKAVIDRFQRFYSARFSLNLRPPVPGKRKVTLVITAGSDTDPLPLILAQLKPVFTICGCELEKAVVLSGTDRLTVTSELSPVVTHYK